MSHSFYAPFAVYVLSALVVYLCGSARVVDAICMSKQSFLLRCVYANVHLLVLVYCDGCFLDDKFADFDCPYDLFQAPS
jgi:hypothetical protein